MVLRVGVEQPLVPVVPNRAPRRLPSATFLVALAALAVSFASLAVTLSGGGSSGSTCGGSEYRVIRAAQLPPSWRVLTVSDLGPMSYALLQQDTSAQSPGQGPGQMAGLSVSVTCFGGTAVDVMREYRAAPPVVGDSPIPAPTALGDDAVAFELNAETSAAQYFVYFRRGGLVATVATGVGPAQPPEADILSVAAAIDRAMATTR